MRPRVHTGLERLSNADKDVLRVIKGRKLGLLAHPASVTSNLVHAQSVVQAQGGHITALFGPEHGVHGHAQDMIGVPSNAHRNIPEYSLYGATEADLKPKAEWLSGLDAVVIDLQDVGSRYYTFVWTAALMIIEAARAGVETIVLDRPNPLSGLFVEGAPQKPGWLSFVGLYPVAIRHGMTLGEVAKFVAHQENIDSSALHVVEMQGWRREYFWDDTDLPWIPPSPNMPTLDTAIVYPGGCLIEGTLLSEGRGTTRPFEMWGAPDLDATRMAGEIDGQIDAQGALLRPLFFMPMFHKFAGQMCQGVQVHVKNRTRFSAWETYLKCISKVAETYSSFAFRTEPYEFVADRPAIDLLTGDDQYRTIATHKGGLSDYIAYHRDGAHHFDQARRDFLLYQP